MAVGDSGGCVSKLLILLLLVIVHAALSKNDIFKLNVTDTTQSNEETSEVLDVTQNTSQFDTTLSSPFPEIRTSDNVLDQENTTESFDMTGGQEIGNETVASAFTSEENTVATSTSSDSITSMPDMKISTLPIPDEVQYQKFLISENPQKEPRADDSTDFWTDFTRIPYDKQEIEDSSTSVYSSTTSSVLTSFRSPVADKLTEGQINQESNTVKHNSLIADEGIAKRKLFSLDLKLADDDDFFSGSNYKSPCDKINQESSTSIQSTRRYDHNKRPSRQVLNDELSEIAESQGIQRSTHPGKRERRINRRNTERTPVQKITVHSGQTNVDLVEDDHEFENPSIAELINVTALNRILQSSRMSRLDQKIQSVEANAHKHRKHARYDVEANTGRRHNVNFLFDDDANDANSVPIKVQNFPLISDDSLLDATPSTVELMLNKKKRDWCTTGVMNLSVAHDGCISKIIKSNFCEGQCKSFYIPQKPVPWDGRRPHGSHPLEKVPAYDPTFRSCGSCVPSKIRWRYVTLDCPNSTPKRQPMRVMRIKRCRCVASTCN